MANAHYFQRYSSPENAVTNNTLLLLSRIHAHSIDAFTDFLNALFDFEIDVSLSITQQTRAPTGSSIPDGMLRQPAFQLVLETKVDAGISKGQLVDHAKGIAESVPSAGHQDTPAILLLLTKQRIRADKAQSISEALSVCNANVKFVAKTFEDICDQLKGRFEAHESHMRALSNDYIQYCADESLIDEAPRTIRVVPCGDSLDVNLRHGMYYMPARRGYRPHRFVGLYKNKAIRAVIDVESVFIVSLDDGIVKKTHVSGELTDRYDEAIRAMIHDAREECSHHISANHRFFCGRVRPLLYRKVSKFGLPGAQYMGVPDEMPADGSIESLVSLLDGESWE